MGKKNKNNNNHFGTTQKEQESFLRPIQWSIYFLFRITAKKKNDVNDTCPMLRELLLFNSDMHSLTIKYI